MKKNIHSVVGIFFLQNFFSDATVGLNLKHSRQMVTHLLADMSRRVCVCTADTLTSRVHAAKGPAQLLSLNAARRRQLAAPFQHKQQGRAFLLRVLKTGGW